LRWRRLVHHVKPGPSPSYGGIQRHDEGIFFLSPWKKAYCPTGLKKSVILIIGPHREEKLKEVYPGTNSKESFAQSRVARYRHQAVWGYVMELQPIELQKICEKRRWRHTETPLHVRFEHHDFGGVRGWHQGFEVSPPVLLRLGGHGALVLQGLDMSILDMAFCPVPMDVLGNLFFFSLSSIVLLLFFAPPSTSLSADSSVVIPAISSSASDVMSSGYESAIEGCAP
jgi:hypothetical protein